MIIERQNILDLIGKNKSKYSSCIITSYTFDFTFFEERVLPVLRTSHIKNVNVFVDGNYLDRTLEESSLNAFKHHRTYSLNPIYSKGVFHPKIMLLTGPKHGLLIIGSGNLTSSGISTNDEIWSAFHINSLDSPNIPLFAEAWTYLEVLFKEVNGFNKQKIDWIYQRATWVNELAGIRNTNFININTDLSIAFLANTNEASIYNRLKKLLPKEKLLQLNIISPYFDENAQAVQSLKDQFNPDSFNLITDSEFGLLPTGITNELNESIKFFDWKDCLQDFDKRFNRLHAKIFQFVFDNGMEYLMLGSANSTVAALGTENKNPINEEAGILLRRIYNDGYIKNLGINFENAEPIDVTTFKRSSYDKGDLQGKKAIKIRIAYAEINGSKLSVIFKKELEYNAQLVLFDPFGNVIETLEMTLGHNHYHLECKNADKITTIVLYKDHEVLSNRVLVHDVNILAKCNPDPSQIELNNLITSLEANPDGDQYIELLHYADYNWVENEIETKKVKVHDSSNAFRIQKEKAVHKQISEEEFNSLESVQQIQMRVLNDPTTQIADVLNIISKGIQISSDEFTESAEESLLLDNEEGRTGEGGAASSLSFREIRGKKIKEGIQHHLQKVNKYYASKLNIFKKNKTFQDCPKTPLTIKDCSHMSIAIDLMCIFQGKSYNSIHTEFGMRFSKEKAGHIHTLEKKYKLTRISKALTDYPDRVYYEVNQDWFQKLKNDSDKEAKNLLVKQEEYSIKEYEYLYLHDGIFSHKAKHGIKKELIETLGSFMICANQKAGFKAYDYEVLNDKITYMRKSLFERATFLINNLHWNSSETVYKKLLLLNLLQFINPINKESINPQQLKESLEHQYSISKKKNRDFLPNIDYYLENLVPVYNEWVGKYDADKSRVLVSVDDLKNGDLIYNMKIGFCSVINYSNQQLHITAPGLDWNEFTKSTSIKINYVQSKIIKF